MCKAIEEAGVKAKIITPDDGGHYFFGYYDLQPFDTTGRYHLCHKAPFEDHIPGPDDVCELGMLDLKEGGFIKLAETTAWNFQQGAMLQWYKDDDHILFNVHEDGAYRCCILNIKTGERRILPKAVANVSNDRTKALCINFSRMFNFRPGYGYNGIVDPYFDELAPEDDGIFLMDMETGDCKLIASLDKLVKAFPRSPYSDGKVLINHINFNTTGDRFAMLFRNFSRKEIGLVWRTQLLTGDLEGNIHCLGNFAVHSHYHWKNDRELLIFSDPDLDNSDMGLYLYHDTTDEFMKMPAPNPTRDLHCLYSPNRRYILGDDYPDKECFRALHLIDTEKGVDTILGKYYSYTVSWGPVAEYRCDLHARYDRTGRYVSFDSNHIGQRCVCLIDMNDLKGYEW